MPTGSTTHRIGAALTAALLAVLLVTFGGAARTPASAQRITAGPTHSSAVTHPTRVLQHVAAHANEQSAPHLDLASMPPGPADLPASAPSLRDAAVLADLLARGVATANGRSPPAL